MAVWAAWWTERFGDVLPLGYSLRDAFPDRWFRIHSLLNSKRYPNDDAERRTLLERQQRLASHLLAHKEPCFVVTPHYGELALGAKQELVAFPNLTFSCELRRNDGTEEPDIACLVAEVNWDATAIKPALLAIANDQLRALWINRTTNAIFAPYDGGVDVVLESRDRRDLLKQHFSDWLSARSDGL